MNFSGPELLFSHEKHSRLSHDRRLFALRENTYNQILHFERKNRCKNLRKTLLFCKTIRSSLCPYYSTVKLKMLVFFHKNFGKFSARKSLSKICEKVEILVSGLFRRRTAFAPVPSESWRDGRRRFPHWRFRLLSESARTVWRSCLPLPLLPLFGRKEKGTNAAGKSPIIFKQNVKGVQLLCVRKYWH